MRARKGKTGVLLSWTDRGQYDTWAEFGCKIFSEFESFGTYHKHCRILGGRQTQR